MHLFLAVGFLSSLTALWRAFGSWPSLLNVLGNNPAVFLAAILGMALAHWP
jgi:hypothetical protein